MTGKTNANIGCCVMGGAGAKEKGKQGYLENS